MSVQSGAPLLWRRKSAQVWPWPLSQVPSVHGLALQLRYATVGAGDGGDGAIIAGGVTVGSGVGVGSPTRQLGLSSGPQWQRGLALHEAASGKAPRSQKATFDSPFAKHWHGDASGAGVEHGVSGPQLSRNATAVFK